MSKVLVISTSLRAKSNSDILTERLIAGARDTGHSVEHISLKGKEIRYCIGCLSCIQTQRCVQRNDAVQIAEKLKQAAQAREQNHSASLTELAALMEPPITKPAMNNRMKKLTALAKEKAP